MVTVLEALKGVNAYPVPLRTLTTIADKRGLSLTSDATQEVQKSKDYNLALADLLLWLSFAPDISQGGQSFSFTDEQRLQLRNRANRLYLQFGGAQEAAQTKPVYGYKGSRL